MNGPPPREAPLYVRSTALARWLFEHLRADGVLGQTIQRDALALLDDIVLALRDIDREQHLRQADVHAVLLRMHLRLAHDVGLLAEHPLVFVLGELDDIGRQLGGWQRRRSRDEQAFARPSPVARGNDNREARQAVHDQGERQGAPFQERRHR